MTILKEQRDITDEDGEDNGIIRALVSSRFVFRISFQTSTKSRQSCVLTPLYLSLEAEKRVCHYCYSAGKEYVLPR